MLCNDQSDAAHGPRYRLPVRPPYCPTDAPATARRGAVILRRGLGLHLAVLCVVWSAWWLAGGDRALTALVEHWPVSVTMVFGSLIAGATSEGGGAVAFPVFTKLLGIAPADARVFSLAIQSVGMTCASLVILALRVPLAWRAIGLASLAGIPGILVGALVIAPVASAPLVRMSFTLLLVSVAITLFLLNRGGRVVRTGLPPGRSVDLALLAGGFVGGIFSGLVGNGIDIITFSVLVLWLRLDEKIATPTSVVLMAVNSLVGLAIHTQITGAFSGQVVDWWLAAVPIVVVGAPLGALACCYMNRHTVAYGLMVLIAIEFITSLWLVPMTPSLWLVSGLILAALAGINAWMYRSRVFERAS